VKRDVSSHYNPRTRLFLPKLIVGSVSVVLPYFLVLWVEPFIGLDPSPVSTAIVIAALWMTVPCMYRTMRTAPGLVREPDCR